MVARDAPPPGRGWALWGPAVGWARETGVRKLELHVFPWNEAAIALYDAFGFQARGLSQTALPPRRRARRRDPDGLRGGVGELDPNASGERLVHDAVALRQLEQLVALLLVASVSRSKRSRISRNPTGASVDAERAAEVEVAFGADAAGCTSSPAPSRPHTASRPRTRRAPRAACRRSRRGRRCPRSRGAGRPRRARGRCRPCTRSPSSSSPSACSVMSAAAGSSR